MNTSKIIVLNGPSEMLPLLPSFVDLSAGTEFDSYKEDQWSFLLRLTEIVAFVAVPGSADGEGLGSHPAKVGGADAESFVGASFFKGCVLRIKLDKSSRAQPPEAGFGMVLVRKSYRGRGIARALMEQAMKSTTGAGRHVLAVCSSLAQPLYRKLGYEESGMVAQLSCTVGTLLDHPRVETLAGEWDDVDENVISDELAARTGYAVPRERLSLLLGGEYGREARSSVAFLANTQGGSTSENSFAIERQDCKGAPFVVGPMLGREECCLPLLHRLIDEHFKGADRKSYESVDVMMMIPDASLVKILMKVKGMKKAWESPAMTSDGQPLYPADSSYLMYMHPTLG